MASNRAPTLEQLERAASSLSPIEREVLVLSAREGLSNDDIAARLGITPEATDRILAHAICRFDEALDRQDRLWWRFW
jgi:DNA-directed RNA polymerase specialized sigma24 family protein